MLIPKKNRREVYKYLFKGEPAAAELVGYLSSSFGHMA
jgi:hypothetical protein